MVLLILLGFKSYLCGVSGFAASIFLSLRLSCFPIGRLGRRSTQCTAGSALLLLGC